MPIKIVDGNLLDATETYLCHQCNCMSQRSAHLAASVFARFPYANVYAGREVPDFPGSITVCGDGKDERFVVCMFGQLYPGCKYPDGWKDGRAKRVQFFIDCLIELADLEGTFAMPWKIGCGAAGGDWENDYLPILEEWAEDNNKELTLYRLEV